GGDGRRAMAAEAGAFSTLPSGRGRCLQSGRLWKEVIMLRFAWLLAAVVLFASVGRGEIVTRTVDYRHGDVELQGFLAYDDAAEGKRPGVLVVHEWWGLGDEVKQRARQLAELGYVAFAA